MAEVRCNHCLTVAPQGLVGQSCDRMRFWQDFGDEGYDPCSGILIQTTRQYAVVVGRAASWHPRVLLAPASWSGGLQGVGTKTPPRFGPNPGSPPEVIEVVATGPWGPDREVAVRVWARARSIADDARVEVRAPLEEEGELFLKFPSRRPPYTYGVMREEGCESRVVIEDSLEHLSKS